MQIFQLVYISSSRHLVLEPLELLEILRISMLLNDLEMSKKRFHLINHHMYNVRFVTVTAATFWNFDFDTR